MLIYMNSFTIIRITASAVHSLAMRLPIRPEKATFFAGGFELPSHHRDGYQKRTAVHAGPLSHYLHGEANGAPTTHARPGLECVGFDYTLG